jgi:hypothetical protein
MIPDLLTAESPRRERGIWHLAIPGQSADHPFAPMTLAGPPAEGQFRIGPHTDFGTFPTAGVSRETQHGTTSTLS